MTRWIKAPETLRAAPCYARTQAAIAHDAVVAAVGVHDARAMSGLIGFMGALWLGLFMTHENEDSRGRVNRTGSGIERLCSERKTRDFKCLANQPCWAGGRLSDRKDSDTLKWENTHHGKVCVREWCETARNLPRVLFAFAVKHLGRDDEWNREAIGKALFHCGLLVLLLFDGKGAVFGVRLFDQLHGLNPVGDFMAGPSQNHGDGPESPNTPPNVFGDALEFVYAEAVDEWKWEHLFVGFVVVYAAYVLGRMSVLVPTRSDLVRGDCANKREPRETRHSDWIINSSVVFVTSVISDRFVGL